MSDIRASFLVLRKELVGCESFSKQVYNHHYQRVLFQRRRKESMIRLIVKAVMAKILFEKRVSFVTEWKYLINHKEFDSMPLIDVDNRIIYRFGKPKVTIKHKNFREKMIDISQLNIDVEAFKELEKQLKEIFGYDEKIRKP